MLNSKNGRQQLVGKHFYFMKLNILKRLLSRNLTAEMRTQIK
ncbi:protein of unknown function [Streptococcus thermophilus]|uniref:Uncharacterized protein n=1 Tax=Streptococcus thermophilus TaxID=1308 RepID=A0A8D6XRJ1_STRTR|nr:protein of unknown function [Streptococcus thermophilus]CAD0152721.1 protein of unknown function [Streptococcus thermophilus]